MALRPPITLMGSKARWARKIIDSFPAHNCFCEPFAGTGAILLAKKPSGIEVYNDVNMELVNLFRVVRDSVQLEQLEKSLNLTLYSRSEFELAGQPTDDPVEKARRYMVRQRQSFSGHGARWSFASEDHSNGMASPARRWWVGVERLRQLHDRLRAVQIENDDWRFIVRRYDGPGTLFYVDPPYLDATRVGGRYKHELTDQDHVDLIETMLGIQGRAVISGYESPSYRRLEQEGWRRLQFDMPAFTSSKRSRRAELIWISPSKEIQNLQKNLAGTEAQKVKLSGKERMSLSVKKTHARHAQQTQQKILKIVNRLKEENRPVTCSSVAGELEMSREHISRRYRKLLEGQLDGSSMP